jgi:hypothetical protein
MQHSNLPVTAVGLGRHIGLRLALDALTLEIHLQQDLAADAVEFNTAARHEYAQARLTEIAQIVAAYFRMR